MADNLYLTTRGNNISSINGEDLEEISRGTEQLFAESKQPRTILCKSNLNQSLASLPRIKRRRSRLIGGSSASESLCLAHFERSQQLEELTERNSRT